MRARRTVSLAIAAVALVALAGPALAAAPGGDMPATTTIITDLPATITLAPGETVKVRLETNLTTGYSWSTKVTGDAAAVTVSKGHYVAPATDLVGAPGKTTWTITAQSDGRAVVSFWATPPGGGTPTRDGRLMVTVG